MDRRGELEAWIANTRRNQRIFGAVMVPLAVAAIVIGPLAFLVVAMIGVTGFWVMYAHNEAHRTKLAELDSRARPPTGPQTGGHRRWRTD
jgi:hypothetical protein